MLRSETLFGKRDANTTNSPLNTTTAGIVPTGNAGTSMNKPLTGAPVTNEVVAPASPNVETGSKLTVGPNIKLKGVEITDCDTLVVEGSVEATINSRVMQIAESGAFKGAAEIDVAEIRGEFNGDLNARQKLVIYSTGKVSGKARCGKLVVEEGGQISGDIQMGSAAVANKGLTVAKVG